MRKGIRVVRGPDWNYDNHDGGEGGVGTVVEVPGDPGFTLPGKFVMVRWDVGEKHLYRIGEGDAYDLFIFNNATAGVSHILPCDGCSDNLVEGLRWKCTRCGDYNLCSTCYMSDKHDLTHEFLRFDSRRSEGFPVPSRSSSQDQRVKSRGIFTGAKVCRGANWMWDNQFGDEGMQGEVVDDKKEVVVQWPTQSVAFSRIGEDGLELLKCVIPANGVKYYKSHLPILGKASEEPLDGLEQLLEFSSMLLDPILGLLAQTATSTCQATIRKGCRVVRGPDWKWAEQDGGEGHTGTILQHTPQKKHVVVFWDSGECCEYRVGDRERFDLRLLDSAPAGIRHINAKCSECLQAPLFGPRWQCSVCQGYDLCSTCYHTDQHELSHSFFRIDKEISRPVPVPARLNSEKIAVVGMAPGAKVQRGKFWKSGNIDGGADKVGQVVAIKKWNPETRRSRVDVLWSGPLTTPVAHRYGHRGKIELKCITPAPGGCYYRDHLAVLGKQETVAPKYKSGDKVNILLEVEEIQRLQEDHGGWTDQMDTHRKKVGTVIKMDDYGMVTVRYDDGMKLMYNQDVLNQIWLNPESLSVATEHNSPSSSKEMKDEVKDELKDEVKDELKDELTLTPGDTQSSHVDTNEDHMGIHPECKICLMRDACVAFVPCGHLVSCPECAEGLDKCPICRSEIKQWLRTFIQ